LAYSYIDTTEYKTEELVIVPSAVTSEGFIDYESVLVPDVDGDGLFQEFSPAVAATLKTVVAPVVDTPATTPGDGSSSVDTTRGVDGTYESDTSSESTDSATDAVSDEIPTPPEPQSEPESPVSLLVPQRVNTTTMMYPWAQFDESVPAVTTEPPAVEPSLTESVEVSNDVVDETETPLISEEATDGVSTEEAPTEGVSDESEPANTEEPAIDTVEVEALPTGSTSTDPVTLFGVDPCDDSICTKGALTFSGFALPEFTSGSVLDGAQLRLSLAAKAVETSAIQRFLVAYSFDAGVTWQAATVIDVEGEVSNSINGDHFLVSLDVPAYTSDLSQLQVKVMYEGIADELDVAYVDAVWLDVTAGSFYEATDFATSTDEITYSRDLEQPELNQLMNPDLDVVLGSVPEFTFEYQTQQNFFRRIFNALFGSNTYAVTNVRLEHTTYGSLDIPYTISYHEDKHWTLSLPNTPQKMHPGKYQVVMTINENDVSYTDSFEFYWGVLAVNTTKTRYTPSEQVTFNLAALTDEGDTICDADLALQVITPNNQFVDVPVSQSGSCGENNITDVPDYLASYTETSDIGEYKVVLTHKNKVGEVVHKIEDRFEVAEFIPYDIERTAPTRIYPPAPYTVSLKIKANRTFTGDIIERVPRGFVIDELREDALIETLPDVTLVKWPNVSMAEGEELTLSYRFDAPDISPYMYLLGPLSMDGYEELRPWQIASDALSGIGWFTGTQTINGANFNAAPSQIRWSTSTYDTYYYEHSTSTNNERVTLRQSGDYFLAVTLPQQRADGNNRQSRVGVEVRVNGVAVPTGLGRSGFIANANNHSESSSHVQFLLTDIAPDDYVEVYAENLQTINVSDTVNVTGRAGLYFEYMPTTETVFAATSTRTVASTSLNTTASALQWTETRQDSGFVHSNTVNPENITISNPGTYMVHINVPLRGSVAEQNVKGRVLLNGVQVQGGIFAQGYQQNTNSDVDSSIHWSGVVVATTSNQVLTVTTEQEAAVGTVTVPPGFEGSIFIQQMPTTDVFVARGRDVVGGTDWNPAAAAAVRFDVQMATSSTFTHSTTTNNQQITVNQAGDYFLTFNGSFTSTGNRINNRIEVLVGGVAVSGAQVKSNFVRGAGGAAEGSSALTYLLTGVATSSIITVNTIREANTTAMNDTTDAIIMLWKKLDFNARPDAPTYYNAPFDNVRFASTTPYFDFVSVDSDGSSDLQYEFAISTTSDFASATIKVSGVDAGFSNTASTTDTSPFVENNRIRYQLQSGDALSDLTTYYWRVRAKDVTGSNQFGDWSTTQSLTVDLAATNPFWYQTAGGQFEANTLIGAVSNDANSVVVDATDNTEILVAYGEGTVTTPRYRLWNGTAWGVEQNAVAVGGTINWVETAAGVTRDEYSMVTLDASNASYAQIYQASTTSWGNQVLMASGVPGPQYRGVDVVYESISGDAMAISCGNTPDPVYRIWNGSSWSATSTINATSLANCNYVIAAADPSSDEIIVVVRDTGPIYEAHVWNGSTWIESRVLGSSPVLTRQGMAVAYEASGDQAVIVTANGTNNNFIYTTWDGTQWSANTTQGTGNDFTEASLVADTNSDQLLLCYVDADADTGVLRWDGGVWLGTFQELETTSNSAVARGLDCEFETSPGRTDYSLIAFSDGTNVRYRTATSSQWATEATIGTVEDSYWVQTERADDGTIVSISLDDTADDFISSYWNGSTWSPNDVIETNPSSVIAAPYEPVDMSAKRYQFTQGIVRSKPIQFSFVPSQPTWGDITFSSTEPFGTDVLVRVRYTATTSCDALVPDSALPGNAAGFDTTELPINISGISTTTYSQLCLEATITTLGSASASLDDWELSWVRQPKLIQDAYRWYANGSFFTPTDAWPLGATDLSELAPINASAPVNDGDVLRLRMSLQGSNVPLPTSTKMFKLQYAPAPSCAAAPTWLDVGAVGSTTAVWRGYANSIVGSDWYNASWPRRMKVSVKSSLVTGNDITNFPVYVNLDDLPAQFFDNLQSDGDDIRITTADGVTEVPYELVSIDTGTDIGELYFRAPSLSTTTDTDFYIYYGNSGASGYAVTDTYGRNNVWSNGFMTVYHLDQNPAGSAPQFIDSTGGSNGTAQNMEAGDRRNGIVGRYIDIDGTNEFVDLGATFSRSFLNSTWQIWASSTGPQAAFDGLLMTRATGETSGINVSSAVNQLGYHWRDAANTYNWAGGPSYPTSSAPFMATLTIEPTRAVMWRHAGIGVASGTNAVAHATGTIAALDIGQDPFGGRLWAGGVDEMTLSNVVRSNGWIQTTYNNRSNATGFYTASAEELIGDGRRLPSAVLSTSDKFETYEENNPTNTNVNSLSVGQSAEWDFVLESNGVTAATQYCFRLVYSDGSQLSSYVEYPSLVTNAAPLAAVLAAPFDNEQLASTSPWFDFTATDEADDVVSYEIQVDDDYTFASPDINRESNANFSEFTNLQTPSERGQYTSGQSMRFVPSTALSNNTTYYWRVRAKDDLGSNTYGSWSAISSFTVNSGTTITTWHQTRGEQFATNNLEQLSVSTSTHDIKIDTGLTVGTTTSTVIDYDDRDTGNAWGSVSFNQNITSGSIRYYVEYRVSGETFALVPDSVLPSNSAGFTSSPINISSLNPTTYNELRLVAVLSGSDTLPRLLDWSVAWGLTIEAPALAQPFDNAKVATTSPAFTFVTADPQSQDLQYEIQISTTSDFTSSSTFISGVDAGFANTVTGGDTSPFNSNETIRYTVQSGLTNNETYWWRVRARDPLGANAWSEYSNPESFTVDTAVTVSTWYQTTGQQFATDELTDIETTAGTAQITSVVREVMMAYGEGSGQAPRYRLWDGTAWGTPQTAESIGATPRWLQLRAAPTRPEYALGTLGTDNDVNVQIYDAPSETWGDMLELQTNIVTNSKRGFDVAYESSSGDLIAVSCDGTEALYAVWNGTSWTGTTTISLANANNCDWVQLTSDPTSDEIIAVFRHTNAAIDDYQALVWSGSGWGNSIVLGGILEDAYEGMAVAYEESGGQAVLVVSRAVDNGPSIYTTWNGTTWLATSTATGTLAMGDHMEWASLKADVGTDRLALCYVDNDADVGVIFWDGSAWGGATELDALANAKTGQPIDCEFEVGGTRDGYLTVSYSDDGAAGVGDGGKYQFFATSSWSGEQDLSTIEDSWRVLSVRGGDGTVHSVFFDDGNDRWSVTNWDGSAWEPFFNITNPPTTGTPFDGYLTMAAQIYPNFTQGTIRSTDINFSDGSGPRWERIRFTDTTPGASDIRYRLYYQSTSSEFVLVPDTALPGNSTGFTTSPVSIAGLDRTVYSVLQLDADLLCVAGNCPTVQDWSLEWSEGITVSGRAYEYDGVSTTTSGTVAVAVNGVLQAGKTGTIQPDGTWSITNVSAFEGQTVMVFVDGAADANESLAVATYDGVGDMTNLELTKRHMTIGSSDTATTTNATLFGYDFTDDEDIFVDITLAGDLNLCVDGCADSRIKVRSGARYQPLANITTHDVMNRGTLNLGTSTLTVRGSWDSTGTTTEDTSSVVFAATSTTETISTTASSSFYNLTFGQTSGTATWTVNQALDVNGALSVQFGTLARGTSSINVARDLSIGAAGTMTGIGTTTFDGTGSFIWTDLGASSTNIGNVVIDGTTKTITLGSQVNAESITIGADDTLNASGSGHNLNVRRNWTNNNSFIPQAGTVTFYGTTTGVIARGASAFNNITFSGVGGIWSFSTSTLQVNGNFTIATGTVTMPTGTTTIAGSFLNTGGNFAHNNGEVRMTSTAGGRSITTNGTAFLNAFYDLVFSGSGAWSFTGAATTSRNLRMTAGTVTFPNTTLTVGGSFETTGSAAFAHNNGEVILLVDRADSITTNGSSLNNVRVKGGTSAWYNSNWSNRVAVTVNAAQVGENVTDFPVYVDLATLPAAFFTAVQGDGRDIRVTSGNGITEIPYELVRISTSTAVGELHFKAPSLSTGANSTFYIYYGNAAATAYATTSTYGRNNVWNNGYTAVYHLDESPTAAAPQYIDSTGSTTGTSANMEAGDQVAAQVGRGQQIDGTNEAIQTTYNRTLSTSTWSVWMNPNGAQGNYDGIVFSRGAVTSGLNVNTAGGIGYHWNDAVNTYSWTGGPALLLNQWSMASLVITPTLATVYRHATSGIATGTNAVTHGSSNINDLDLGQDDAGGRFFSGILDEVRISNVARTQGWLTTEYNNLASSSAFASVSGVEARFARTFADTNATILGNYVSEGSGDAIFPTGVLSVGGSFDNNALFTANNGTVRFNSTAGSETIAAGSSTFATIEFNATSGDFTIVEHATATVAVNLVNATQFTLQSGLSLTASGTFTQSMSGAATTWTGSTLRLLGSDHTINAKTHSGDTYATLETQNDTDIAMWNSSATSYVTGSTSSIYSQDHAGVDGDLNIYGNYVRTTGTEHWAYGTDFDGTALLASTSRAVNIRIASSSVIGFVNASLNFVGATSATSSLAAISGSYSLNASNTTITANRFSVAGTDGNGFGLLASSTITTMQDGFYTVVPGRTGFRIDSGTVITNNAKQFERVGFATTSAGAATNVTLVGTTTSFVWFRSGTGNLYGEAFDANDANPGAIRFDDSSYLITISGRVLTNNGSGAAPAVCNGTNAVVRVVVNSGSYTASTTCAAGTGAYTLTNVAFTGDPTITVYLNTNGGTNGTVITKTPSANITNFDLYTDQIILRHEGVTGLTTSDLTRFDTASDTDIRFTATTTGSTTLNVLAPSGLFIWSSSTYTPNGAVTLRGNASSSAFEGTLTLGTSSSFVAQGTETHTLAGRLVVGSNATITAASSTFVFNATTTGKSITSSSSITFHNLSFTGVGGAWNITAPLLVDGAMQVATGTVTGTSNITLRNGALTGDGTLSLGGGTVTIWRTSTLGGIRPWTFANLTLGDGVTVGTTTPASSATTTVSGVLTVANVHTLDAQNSQFNLSGAGTVFVTSGTFRSGTGRVTYSGANATVLSTTYNNLVVAAPTGSSTFTGTSGGLSVLGTLTIGNGTASSTLQMNTNDPLLTVSGFVYIAASSTLGASDSATSTFSSSYENDGRFTANNGRVLFNGAGTHTIAAGQSSFANVTINGVGNFTVTEHATATSQFLLQNHTSFTVATTSTLAVGGAFFNTLGGAATDFPGTVLLFGGGTQSINASTTADTYSTLAVASSTRVRMWNSSAASYQIVGGLYSQDHAATDGLLHIYGTFAETSANDYWSYATDFDGTNLTGGNERAVTVRMASSSVVSWLGGSLSIIGSTTATTSVENQGTGTYSFTIGGTASTTVNTASFRNLPVSGVVLSGTPTVVDFSRTDHLVQVNTGTGITVGGTVINVNEAKNFTNNRFVADVGVTGATNVTATGTAVSSWRFTNHSGALSGEANDVDPAGDPGYLVWDDSAALITVSGNVYSDEGVTVSTHCDGVTNNVVLRVAGLTTYSTTCNATTGAYSIPNVAYNSLDSLVLYLDGESAKAANVTRSPISSISNFNLYENRVIVRHESTDPLTIANMAVWDSSDDADIPFTAVDAGSDTLTLPADYKLLIWTGKTFAPAGAVTLTGNGGGAAYDGTLEALTNARFRAAAGENHSIGGSFIFGTGAVFESNQATTTFTANGAGRTIDVNESSFGSLAFTGSGTYTITDTNLTATRAYVQSAGTVIFGNGTTTIGSSFNATGGTFTMSGVALVFTSTTTGNIVRFDDSTVPTMRFTGAGGSWSMTDTNATTTGSFVVANTGTVSLPSGNLGVGGSFTNASGTITHNTSDIVMTATTSQTLTARTSDLFALRKVGAGTITITDESITFRDDIAIASGTLVSATNTLAVGGSFTVTNGAFNNASGTVLFNAVATGKTINASTSAFFNVNFGSASGGWTWQGNATATNNLTLTSANSFTKEAGTVLSVGGVFTNLVGGAPTTWTNTTLRLTATSTYTINTKTTGGDDYATIALPNLAIRAWNSTFATTTLGATSSIYSQDNAAVDGALTIYGDLRLATTTEHWSYATDFDGTTLTGGQRRAVSVRMAPNATTTLQSGTLNIVGVSTATTTIGMTASGTFAFAISGGTYNADHYSITGMNASGLNFSGTPAITTIQNGRYELVVNGGTLITVPTTTLDANASKIFDAVGFTATTGVSGNNVTLVGSTSNAWRFTNSYGNLGGESFDIDGIDACGAIRFDNSACLLTAQTNFRWRADDGGEGAPSSEWFNTNWDYRQRVRVQNPTATAFSTTSVKVTVPYDASMQTDFDDIRFTTSDGVTPADFWTERVVASTEATVWVEIPSLPASGIATVFMYYGNASSTSSSSAANTFVYIDDFEDNNITEYSGDTSLFQTDTNPVYGGTYALEASNKSGRTTDGLYRNTNLVAQGQIIRYRQYVDLVAGSGDEGCTMFGVQSNQNQNYAVCLELFGTDRISLARDVDDNDLSGTVLASTTVTYTTGWYEVQVDWQTNNNIAVYLYNPSGTLVASTTATDSTYTNGGVGYTFWIQNGAWDSYTARNRGPINPIVYLGAKQTDGGATWLAAQNAAGSGLPNITRRLRIGIENSGLTVSGQTYRLQYAAKGAAPTCEAVSSGSFAAVPNQASCGSSPICMQTSSNVADGDTTTDLLTGLAGQYSIGALVESPSNVATALTLNQGNYTELEYVLTATNNASDSYCLRVVNNTTPLDFYAEVAELSLQFDPSFGPVTLNGGADIALIPGTTTRVYATGTVTDFNGYTDLVAGTSTIYRSGAGAACTPDNNNCYISQTGGSCSFTSCSGNTCTLNCYADIFFHADPTATGTYSGQEWIAYMEAEDTGGGYDFASAPGVELLTVRALTVDNGINYGALAPSDNTGDTNATTTVSNIGNVEFDIEVQGTDLTDGGTSYIPSSQQKFATSTFSYSGCITCSFLSSSTPVELAINLAKPTNITVPNTPVYWGIAIPPNTKSAPHSGINVFTPVSP
jgi:hypothetical protein